MSQEKPSVPLPGAPHPPPHHSAIAKKKFRETAAMMAEAGTVSLLDQDAIAQYCNLWARWREAEDTLKLEGAVLTLRNGSLQQNPWYKISCQCTRDLRQYADRLGLTPASREKLSLADAEDCAAGKWGEFE